MTARLTAGRTPRRHAVLATLAGVVAGAAIVAVIALVRGGSDDDPAADRSPSQSVAQVETRGPPDPDSGPLDPSALEFEPKKFGTKVADITLEVPKGWKYVRQDEYNAWFVGPASAWRLRVDATANPRTIDQMMTARERSLRSTTKELKVLHRDKGTEEVAWSPGTLTHRTLTYTYLNTGRGHRLVINRFVALGDGGRTAVEITTSGRPEDETGLNAVLAQATTTLVLAG
jgi:hypothetical protein